MAETATEDVLRWEAQRAPRAAIAAAAGGLLIIASAIATVVAFRDAPTPSFVDSLQRAGRPGGVGDLPSLRTPSLEYYNDHAVVVVLAAIALGAGFVAVGFMLAYLGVAVRNRSTAFRRMWIYATLGGAILGAVAISVYTLERLLAVHTFLSSTRTVDRAADLGDSSLLIMAQLIGIPGTQAIGLASLALGLGWVVICLNAMRVGLLTRFMGVLGIICGVLIVLPLLGGLPIVQTFWLVAVALLLVNRWPSGMPPAWSTGEATPWPSQQQVRGSRRRGAAAPEPEPDPPPEDRAAARPHPASKKKKRKRRA
jgi:hypothetical protein